jgi:uncharacterized iron-regulated protein
MVPVGEPTGIGRRAALSIFVIAHLLASASPAAAKIIFRLQNRTQVSLAEMVADLKKARVVVIGESHGSAEDHVAQRTVIQALHDGGAKVSIGLEMFRAEEQPALDRWVGRTMEAEEFRKVYNRNWAPGYWNLYNDILIYARQEGIPLVGLNIREEIPNQVSRGGFDSLGLAERQQIGLTSCEIPDRYEDLLRRVLGEKAKASPQGFENFCQAQLVWDHAMARAIAGYVAANPGRTLVVLCGTFHAWRHGIPQQIERVSAGIPLRIILPSSDKTFLNYDIFLADADYVWWQQ